MDEQRTQFSWAVNIAPFQSIKFTYAERKQRNPIAVRPDKVLAKMGDPEECKDDLVWKISFSHSSASCQCCYCQGKKK